MTRKKTRTSKTKVHVVKVLGQGFVKGEVFCFRYPYFYF